MRKNKYGYQMHSTYAYCHWAKSLLASCWSFKGHLIKWNFEKLPLGVEVELSSIVFSKTE